MSGFGDQPAGGTTAGAFIPQPASTTSLVYPDPITGRSDSGRLIDPATRTFVSTADGRFKGMSSVAQCVLIAWGTIDNSSIGPLDTGYAERARSVYLSAVQSLTSSTPPRLQIVDFAVAKVAPTRIQVRIRWRDLTTNVEDVFQR